MGLGLLIDSNVIIELHSNKLDEARIQLLENNPVFCFDISKIEVLGFPLALVDETELRHFFNCLPSISLDDKIIEMSILIRKTNKIKLGDAIIAATALVSDPTLLTRNVTDFKRIEGLVVLDSHQ